MVSDLQYDAVRNKAGVLPRDDRAAIGVAGADRAAYLHNLLTNDILGLTPGTGCYAAYLTPQGRMIADMNVANLGEQLLLDVPAGVKNSLIERFEQLVFTEDVRVEDLSTRWGSLGLHGPASWRILTEVATLSGGGQRDLRSVGEVLSEHENVLLAFAGDPVVAVASRDLGEPGFHLYVDRSRAGDLQAALVGAGAVPVDAATTEVLRVEAGRPLFPIDMDEDTIPLEAGIEDRAISFTKGCYVGQEVIIRVLHRGHGRVARKLVGLVAQDEGLPTRDDLVFADGLEVGRVTSAARSPRVGRALALAYVRRDRMAPGTKLVAGAGPSSVSVEVASLPFHC